MSFSDYDRNKDKKKKKIFNSKESKEEGHLVSGKQPIILAKPDRDREWDRDRDRSLSDSRTSTSSKTSAPGTIILRTRDTESRAVSPSQKISTVLRKEGDVPPSYQIATKPSTSENTAAVNPLTSPPQMLQSVMLMDDTLQFCDAALEFLVDQTDFFVVGCLGMKGSGKSTVMSALSGRTDCFSYEGKNHIPTRGIEMFVTPSRMILLDTQAMMPTTFMDRILQQDKKYSGEFQSSENSVEILSMQIAAFLFSVCHVVIVVQPWLIDSNFMRFLQAAEMLKPSAPTTSSDEEIIEYYPHILFVLNRVSPMEFTSEVINSTNVSLKDEFAHSQMHIMSGLTIATGQVLPHLSPTTCDGCLNIYMLPEKNEFKKDMFRGHPGYEELVRELRHQLLNVTLRQQLTPSVLSEKHWFHYASKMWDNTKKCIFFTEYTRFLS